MNIKELKKKYGVNQTELAKIAGVSQKSISSYDRKESEPIESTLIKIADYFQITIDELVGHEVPYLIDKSLLSNEELEIISEIKNLDTMQRIKVLAYIDGLKAGKQNQDAIKRKFEEM